MPLTKAEGLLMGYQTNYYIEFGLTLQRTALHYATIQDFLIDIILDL